MENHNDKQPLITIAVAAYNVDRWLNECLDSILKQTYLNWECLIVNDGSTDETKAIALKYCAQDKRFKLINKENGGLSTVRNMGLDASKGLFIQFVDGDDILMEDCLEYSIDNIGENDVLASDCISITETGKYIRQTFQGKDEVIDSPCALKWTLDRKILSSVWSKFYRRDVIDNLRFNLALRGGQDIYFNTELFLNRPDITIKISNHPTYKYRIINNSVSHIKNEARKKRQVLLVSEMDCLYERNKVMINQNCLDEYAKNMVRELLFYYSLQGPIKRTEKTLLPLLRKWHNLLVDKTSSEFVNTKFVNKEISLKTDILITMRYLPNTIREYIKAVLWKVRK